LTSSSDADTRRGIPSASPGSDLEGERPQYYSEGIFVGYRWYARTGSAAVPLGQACRIAVRLSAEVQRDDDGFEVSFRVRNVAR